MSEELRREPPSPGGEHAQPKTAVLRLEAETAVVEGLLNVFAECQRRRAAWHLRLHALLQEDDRMARSEQDWIATAAPPTEPTAACPQRSDLKSLVRGYERTLIKRALAVAGGRQNRAAAALGLSPTTLNDKIKRLGIPSADS